MTELFTFFNPALLLVFCAGLLAGLANALAGGGTLILFPVLMACGLAPITANATNAIGVWPGHAMSAWQQRARFHSLEATQLRPIILVTVLGGIVGAICLHHIPATGLMRLIPLLILFATLLFAFGPQIIKLTHHRSIPSGTFDPLTHTPVLPPKLLQPSHLYWFFIAVYGGFFGAGMGVLIMAALQMSSFSAQEEMVTQNAIKNLIATGISLSANILLIFMGLVTWQFASIAFVGAIFGGILGAKIGNHLSPQIFKAFIVAVGLLLTLYYAWQQWF